jgi:hypothetical protein
MNRSMIASASLVLLAGSGCPPVAPEPPSPVTPPAVSRPDDRRADPAPSAPSRAQVSWETDRDKTYAEFLRDHSGGMIAKAAVGIEKSGMLRVELDRSVAPDDTLELTKSLMAGARKDFPDKPITLAVFDPGGDPILKARFRPGEGLHYQIVHPKPGESRPGDSRDRGGEAPSAAPKSGGPLANSGVTEADRKFAAWAETHGRSYLRYVEADLERHGRLWFGVSREVKPDAVPELTRSLLEGARKEFPRGELIATVFDPEGERIGKAHLAADGKVHWEK